MKRKYWIMIGLGITIALLDRPVFMKQRVLLHNLWDWESGEIRSTMGDFIATEGIVSFKRNIMVFDNGDSLLLKWQYFNTMKVVDLKTGKEGEYMMKGANWITVYFN